MLCIIDVLNVTGHKLYWDRLSQWKFMCGKENAVLSLSSVSLNAKIKYVCKEKYGWRKNIIVEANVTEI